MKRTHFLVELTDGDEIDVWFDVHARRVVAFSVNDRAMVEGKWREVIRFDTAHGRPHVHRFWEAQQGRRRRLLRGPDLGELLSRCIADVRSHWSTYRAMLEAVR